MSSTLKRPKSKIGLGGIMNAKVKSALLSYLYAAISVAAALWVNGERDLKTIGLAIISAFLAPAAQALNPRDASFGFKPKK